LKQVKEVTLKIGLADTLSVIEALKEAGRLKPLLKGKAVQGADPLPAPASVDPVEDQPAGFADPHHR
jgi:hypothetical protein